MRSMQRTALLLMASILLPACAVNEVITAEETTLIVAEAPPAEEMLLDIGIIQFAEGVPAKNDPGESGIRANARCSG